MSTPQRPQPASLTPWGCDLDVIGIHRGLGGLPVQQGGFISQVQCPQLGGAIRNWEKGGGGVCVCVCVCAVLRAVPICVPHPSASQTPLHL